MAKRIRKKRPKRSSQPRQGQQLSQQVRGLYSPGDDADAEWAQDFEVPPSDKRPPRSAQTRNDSGKRSNQGETGQGETGQGAAGQGATGQGTAGQDDGLRGEVVTLFSGLSQVESAGQVYECVLPSRLAQDQQSAVAVGDQVVFAAHGESHRISRVLPRRTVLSRPDPHNPRLERVVAANVDVVVQVASVVKPPLRLPLIDRYLIAIERGGARPLLCVNKIDLLGEDELARELEQLEDYRRMGLPIFPCSASQDQGIDRLREALSGHTSVFVGHSGVGKSSLLLALAPDLEVAIGQLSQRFAQGTHTTTRSRLYRLAGDVRLIDTPGIREMGLWKMTSDELRFYFPDFDEVAADCRFSNCTHTHEPHCAVRLATRDGRLSKARYATYRRILESLGEEG